MAGWQDCRKERPERETEGWFPCSLSPVAFLQSGNRAIVTSSDPRKVNCSTLGASGGDAVADSKDERGNKKPVGRRRFFKGAALGAAGLVVKAPAATAATVA